MAIDLESRDSWVDPASGTRFPLSSLPDYRIVEIIIYLHAWHPTMFRTAHGLDAFPEILVDPAVMCAWLLNKPIFRGLIFECRGRRIVLPANVSKELVEGLAAFGDALPNAGEMADSPSVQADRNARRASERAEAEATQRRVEEGMHNREQTVQDHAWQDRLGVPARRIHRDG